MLFARSKIALPALMLGFGLVACGPAEPAELPPLGEVVVSIDTDAPVPDLVGRLRIDVFDASGEWLETRDLARNNASDWPASFSLFTKNEGAPSQVLVRARGYLEGRERDYHGEVFEPRVPYVEPWAASSLPELCANLPELTLGQPLTLRRGTRLLTSWLTDPLPPEASGEEAPPCWATMAGGTVAARLQVATAGDYRIETTYVDPVNGDPNLFIRSDCRDALTQIACNDDISRDQADYDDRARLVLHLEPGSYTVMSGSFSAQPSNVTLRADLAANWQATAPTDGQPAALGTLPRLLVDGVDETPRQEPQPLVTIDRLALLTLTPGRKQSARIVLRTACAGQMAKLAASNNEAPVLAEAETCIDTEGQRMPLAPEPQTEFSAESRASAVGSFAPLSTCATAKAPSGALCIPSGSFVLGSPLYAPYPLSTTPERFALMDRYWLDETEVTVARWRSAVARGFRSPNFTPISNDHPLGTDDAFIDHCTFSQTPDSAGEQREDFPLNCVDWDAARAFCQFEGGDLPSEAQWQYAVSKAGRSAEVDDLCVQTLGPRATAGTMCPFGLGNPVSVNDPAVASDITPLGVRGLVDNLAEWSLDSFQPFDGACWNGSTLRDPICWEQNAPERTVVGTNWTTISAAWRRDAGPNGSILYGLFPVAAGDVGLGFRCAYSKEPQ